jgi:hypothetical protein
VEEGFVIRERGRTFLPVGLIGVDDARKVALIELPHEADSGANRVWVPLDDVRIQEPVS